MITLCLSVSLAIGSFSVSWSGIFQKGLDAYEKGDYATALKEWTPLAEGGDAVAQYNLGLMYRNGQGVPQDDKTAVKWYTLSAEQGDAFAQVNLGIMYDLGQGVPQDDKTAVKWYTLAAEQGDSDAQVNLGFMYAYGEGVIEDIVYAHMWANISASNGDKNGKELKDLLTELMTPSQIEEAQRLAKECLEAINIGVTCVVEPVTVIAENVHGSKLPPCPDDTSKVFNNCYGYSDFEDGASYKGEWQNDNMHGIGTYTYPKEENGQYIGNFVDNEFSGQGKLTFPDLTYEGNFKNDVFEGQGTLITEEGKFVGNFKDGELDGLGKYYDESGELIFDGEFAKGEPVQPHVEPTPSGKDNDDGELFAASSGTGFYVTNDGYLLTNHHVINGCQKVGFVSRGELIDTKIIAFDKINDLAILKVSKEPEDYLTISRDLPEITEEIIVAGFPFGEEFSSTVKVTKGIVSSLAGVENNYSEIQIDAAIQPGNSGGPIINEYGNVVGIAVAGLDQQYVQENFGVTPESSNFGVKASVAINLLNANGIRLEKPRTSVIKRHELGEKIRKATLYLSCVMTLAQIEQVKTKKLLFKKYE